MPIPQVNTNEPASAFDPLRTLEDADRVTKNTIRKTLMTDKERERWGSPIRKRLYYSAVLAMLAVAAFTLVRSIG